MLRGSCVDLRKEEDFKDDAKVKASSSFICEKYLLEEHVRASEERSDVATPNSAAVSNGVNSSPFPICFFARRSTKSA